MLQDHKTRALTPRRLRALLKQLGLGRPHQRIEEHPRSGRNRLFLVKNEGPSEIWMAKQVLGPSAAERWFYDEIAGHLRWTPSCVATSANHNVVVFDYTDRTDLLSVANVDPEKCLGSLAGLGPALAGLHAQEPGDSAPSASLPMPAVDPASVNLLVGASSSSLDFIRRIQLRPILGSAIQEVLAFRGPKGLIHGDLKLDNLVFDADERLTADEESPRCGVLIADWELCGVGPLGWDVGSLIGAMVLLWAQHLALDGESEPDDWIERARIPFPYLHEVACAFIKGYLDSASAAKFEPPDRDLVVKYAVAFMVTRTLAEVSLSYGVGPHHLVALNAAAGLLLDAEELFGDVSW